MDKINITKENYDLYESYFKDKKDINVRFRKKFLKVLYFAYIPVILTSGLALITLSKIMFGLEISIISLFVTDVIALLGWGGCAYKNLKTYEKEELSLINKYNQIYIDKDWFVDDIEKMLEDTKIYNKNYQYYEEAKKQIICHTEYRALDINKRHLSTVSLEEIKKAENKVKVLQKETK